MDFQTVNPATGVILQKYQHLTLPQAQAEVEASWKDFEAWRKTTLSQRAQALRQWAHNIEDRRHDMALSITREMGKPITEAKNEVTKCIKTIQYFAEMAPRWLEADSVVSDYAKSKVVFQPLGPILAIMPWNFPLWQVIRFAAPSLMVGNTILLKHADLTVGTAEQLVQSAKGVFGATPLMRHCPVDHEVAAQLMSHPRVRGVTFTGSTRGGREIAAIAGKALKKVVLELGGSDAYVILKDADLDRAAKICAQGRMVNGGQSCVAAKRFIVEKPAQDKFVPSFVSAMKSFTPGDPEDENTKLGPMASKKFQTQLVEQVSELTKKGGRILCGGTIPQGPGADYPPTVILFEHAVEGLGDIEVFGPVAVVILVADEAEALKVANDSPYGLGGAVFTSDNAKGERFASEMEAGFVVVNDQVKSDARLPFGGVKDSGYGRELAIFGLREFCNIKTLAIGKKQ